MLQTKSEHKNSSKRRDRLRAYDAFSDSNLFEYKSTDRASDNVRKAAHNTCYVNGIECIDQKLDEVIIEGTTHPQESHDAYIDQDLLLS